MKPYPIETLTLAGLAEAYLTVKQAEAELTAHRREIARQIQELTGQYQEGQKTFRDGTYTVTVEQPVNHTMDWSQWDAIVDKIPEALRPVRYKPELDITGVRYLQNNEPEIYAILATAMTAKPGSVRITVKKGEPS